jgi:uncharacterized protein YodC (DUF2158 family)
MSEGFQLGDVVLLKSGGLLMTIESIENASSGHKRAFCVWFDENKEVKSNSFLVHTLEKSKDF